MKVLLTSGYAEEAFEHHGRPDPDTPILRKPYRRKDLEQALRRVLDGPAWGGPRDEAGAPPAQILELPVRGRGLRLGAGRG
jgi:hypothetical protein